MLRKIDLNEADQIIVVLTADKGRLSVMSKGSRRLRSKFSGHLELLQHIQFSCFQGRSDVAYLNDAEGETLFDEADLDLRSRGFLFYLAETTHKLLPEGQACTNAYRMLLAGLSYYDKHSAEAIFYACLTKLLTALGFMSSWQKCSMSDQKLDLKKTHYLSLSDLNLVSSDFSRGEGVALSPSIIKWFNYMQQSDFAELSQVRANPQQKSEVFKILKLILDNLITSPFKSEAFLYQM